MKKIRLVVIISLILMEKSFLYTQKITNYRSQNWSSGSAILLPAGRTEIGLFQPLRYGWSESLEFSTHPLVDFLMPNLSVKWAHDFHCCNNLATQHSFYYPTFLLRTISREGTGWIISPEFEIPHIICFNNEILLSSGISENHLITGKAGFSFALKSGDFDERTTIDLPLVFPRLVVFYHVYGFRIGFDLAGKIYHCWHYATDSEIFLTPGAEESFANH